MTEALGVALIGTGMWGRRLAATVRRSRALELVACYSRDDGNRLAFADEFECHAAATMEQAIENPKVEAVLVITPNHTHAEVARACAERGRHVFMEKPIADEMADGEEIQQVCEQAGVVLLVGHCFRRLGAARRTKQLIEQGALGEVVLAEANFSLPGRLTPDTWRYYRETCPGGPLMQLGVHHADTLQYWLGPVRRVQGSFARLATHAEIDDVGLAGLEFASGAPGVIHSSYVSPKTYQLRLYGSKGNVSYITDMSVWPEATKVDGATRLTLHTNDGDRSIEFPKEDMLAEQLKEFAQCIQEGARPETGAREGLAALAVIRAAIRAHETGTVQTLELAVDV